MINRSDLWRRMREMLNRGAIEIPRYVPHPDRPDLPGEIDAMLGASSRRVIEYGGGPGGGKTAAIEEWLAAVNRKVKADMPMEFGLDLAHGKSETWHVSWDHEAGKMIYRKVDPADMVRRDEEGEGSPDNGSD